MPEITRDYIEGKRRFIQSQFDALNGALELLKVMEDELFPQQMSLDDVKQATGAVEIGPVKEVK